MDVQQTSYLEWYYFQKMFKCVSKHPYIKLTRIPFLNTLNILSPSAYAISHSREMK